MEHCATLYLLLVSIHERERVVFVDLVFAFWARSAAYPGHYEFCLLFLFPVVQIAQMVIPVF